MGLFDDLFGSKQTTTTNNTTTGTSTQSGSQQQQNTATSQQNTNQQQQQSSTSNTSSTSQQAQQQSGTTVSSSLDNETISLLKNLLGDAGNVAGGGADTQNVDALRRISDDLYAKASGGNAAAVQAVVDASQESARLDYETGQGAQINTIQQQIGSRGNSYSQLLQQKGVQDLTTRLAQIAASGALQAEQMNSQDLTAAAGVIQSASGVAGQDQANVLNPVLQLVNVLKGATQTSQNTSTQTGQSSTQAATSEQTLANLIATITGQTSGQSNTTQQGTVNTVNNTTGTEQTKGSKGIIGDILSIF